jgi:alanine racemase
VIQYQTLPLTQTDKFIVTDSRLITDADESIFFAIRGVRHNGHDYIPSLLAKGVRYFVIEETEKERAVPFLQECTEDIHVWVVPNAIHALQKLAGQHRKQFQIPVIGITGSNGKTIVKEWLAGILQQTHRLVKSPRSYNSQIGVALSVLQMKAWHEVGIFEAGISQQDEMQKLADIIQPTIGIFTTLGTAHDEGFRSQKQKVTEKLRLFRQSKYLIYCYDHEIVQQEIQIFLKAVNPTISLVSWSFASDSPSTWHIQKEKQPNGYQLTCQRGNEQPVTFSIPFRDDASIENAVHTFLAAQTLADFLQIPFQASWISNLASLRSLAMRLELKQGIYDTYLIDDTYNNDLGGLQMALSFMNQQHTKRDKVVIISDMLQTGLPESELYQQISGLTKTYGIQSVIGIGEAISRQSSSFHSIQTYSSTDEFIKNHSMSSLKNSLILIKGARSFAFEQIVQRLVQKVHGTSFEINLDALTHNLNFYRSKVKKETKLMAMVKAFAYGSGSNEVASLLQYHRVNYLAVAYTDEGVSLRENGIHLPILVLNPQPETYQKLIEYRLEPEIFSKESWIDFSTYLRENTSNNTPYPIHIKVDTGMHRLGFTKKDIPFLIEEITKNSDVRIATVFSHLVGADEAEHNEFSKMQIATFQSIYAELCAGIGYKPDRHICNTAGILRFPEAHFEMVRLGIGLHGVEVTGIEPTALLPVGTLKTTISQIKELAPGETVGYSRKGQVNRVSKIATIAIGYADGYDRRFSKGVGKVIVNGVACPVIGNVCMDMTMIDVTDVDCEIGDTVEIFGKQQHIKHLADSVGTIPYEILTNVSERVKRIFYKE